MASTSSREAALERRKALTTGGKKVAGRYSTGPSRVRSATDARPTRTNTAPAAPAPAATSTTAAASRPTRPSRPSRSPELSRPASSESGSRRSNARPISNPSRDLVLARREALARNGKRANTSRDRTRSEVRKPTATGAGAPAAAQEATAKSAQGCKCQERETDSSRQGTSNLSSLASSRSSTGRNGTPKRTAQHNPSRALVLARREALAKRGKSATMPNSSSSAAVARQGNPDLSTRELAQKVRELKSRVGSAGSARNSGTRPTGPNRQGARQAAASDASWKVGASQTLSGQVVTGTQANRSARTTGNEAATCRTITGTEYLGAEVFQTFCQTQPAPVQPAKVRISTTGHGNRVTGNEVGRSEKVTGDEPGTCKIVTGTDYLSPLQQAAHCGATQAPAPRKVGQTLTQAGRPVSGVMVGRSEKVTGDESGSGRQITGNQYMNTKPDLAGRAPTKVSSLQTLRGTGITGTHVGRSEHVTGDEPGSCRIITGDEYIGSQQYEGFCGSRPAPEAAKVGFSITNRSQVVSGTRTGRSEKVTGDEPGTCKVVTGTPYAGMEEAGNWCSTGTVDEARRRTPARAGTPGPRMTGLQPGIGGVMTGAARGACEAVTGTPYVGVDQMAEACGAASVADADFPKPLEGAPWQQFSVQSPARVAQVQREHSGGVTGSSYEFGGRITGPFDLGTNKVTGTEQFRFDRNSRNRPKPAAVAVEAAAAAEAGDSRPVSRVTGEGSGAKITGDDWDRGERVTGTEGVSARRRNPSRNGGGQASMPMLQRKRNEEVPAPVSRVTGSSGNTERGSLITVSGGARG
jgi:hypothetical protein